MAPRVRSLAADVEQPRQPARHQLGVLFVHGIGRQTRGDTLISWGDSLANWITRAGSASEERGLRAEVVSAMLDDDSSDPPHAVLHVSDRTGGDETVVDERAETTSSWLLAESWWAESFAPPTFGQLVTWSLQTVPWAISIHFARRVHYSLDRIRAAGRWPTRLLRVAELLTGSLLGLTAGLFLSPFVLALLILLLLVGVLPIPQVRSFVAAVQRGLAGSVGDSLVLSESPVQAAAIRTRLHQALAWMSPRCERLAVVAHSQGAAIAVDALGPRLDGKGAARPLPGNLDALVTFGSGVTKLAFLQAVRSRPNATLSEVMDMFSDGPEDDEDEGERLPGRPNPWWASAYLLVLVGASLWLWARFAAGELTLADALAPLAMITGAWLLMTVVPMLSLLLVWPLFGLVAVLRLPAGERLKGLKSTLKTTRWIIKDVWASSREGLSEVPKLRLRLGCLLWLLPIGVFVGTTMAALRHDPGFLRLLGLMSAIVLGSMVAMQTMLLVKRRKWLDSEEAMNRLAIVFWIAMLLGMTALAVRAFEWNALFALVVVLLFWVAGSIWHIVRWVGRETIRLDIRVRPEVSSWIDFYASADPVPNGPTRGTEAGRPESVEIVNGASMLRDHTTYWKNLEEFVAPLAARLLAIGGGPLAGPGIDRERLEDACRRRRRRVGMLKLSRGLLVGAALAYVVVRWERVPQLGRATLGALRALLDRLPFDLKAWLPEAGTPLIAVSWGLLLVLLWGLAAYAVVLLGWKLWNAHDGLRFSESRQFAVWPIVVWALALVLVGLAWLADAQMVEMARAAAGALGH